MRRISYAIGQESNAIGQVSSTCENSLLSYRKQYEKDVKYFKLRNELEKIKEYMGYYYGSTKPISTFDRYKTLETRISPSKDIISVLSDYGMNFNQPKFQDNRLVIGQHYSLKGIECDDFTMPTKIYELVAILDTVNGINVDSVIMKQISGPSGVIFTLTKTDCSDLNIPFQQGLQIFPKNMQWNLVVEDKKEEQKLIDTNNLSTYPTSPVDGTVRNIIIKLDDFTSYRASHIITSNGKLLTVKDFVSSLIIKSISNIDSIDMCSSFNRNENIPFRIITKQIGAPRYGENCIADKNNHLFIELDLSKPTKLKNQTVDDYIGVSPKILDNKSINDLFEISWIEPEENNHKTVEEKSNWLMQGLTIPRLYNPDDYEKFIENEINKFIGMPKAMEFRSRDAVERFLGSHSPF